MQQLRENARRGIAEGPLRSQPAPLQQLRALEWAELRAQLQHTVVRRQVVRTQAAALHAQMLHPPPLPPAPPLREVELGGNEVIGLSPLAGLKPAVQAAHRRSLAHARLALEAEEAQQQADEAGAVRVVDAAATERAAARLVTAGLATDAVSSAELLWLAGLEAE